MSARYDELGRTYTVTRRPDPRLAAAIDAALGDARTVVNVGAGAGAYEPTGRDVVAVEPSAVMLGQRPPGAAPAVQASAEGLPFVDGAFDAAMAVLTIHHWAHLERGLAELRRVARRVVVLTWDQAVTARFWLTREYLPEVTAYDETRAVAIERLVELLGGEEAVDVSVVPIAHDCTDGFLGAWWRRPEAYLDPVVRAGISALAPLEDRIGPGLARLAEDLRTGAWQRRHAELLALEELDVGYRLVVSAPGGR